MGFSSSPRVDECFHGVITDLMTNRVSRAAGFVEMVALGTIALYAAIAWTRVSELGNGTAQAACYNLLVDGFRAGQLSPKLDAPPGLPALADPYDPGANSVFRGDSFTGTGRLHDLSYYRGRLYLYFGVAPALLLFWPYEMVTGHYL